MKQYITYQIICSASTKYWKRYFPASPFPPLRPAPQYCFMAGKRQSDPFSCWRAHPPSRSPASGTKAAKIIAIGKNSFSPPLFESVVFMPCQPCLAAEPRHRTLPGRAPCRPVCPVPHKIMRHFSVCGAAQIHKSRPTKARWKFCRREQRLSCDREVETYTFANTRFPSSTSRPDFQLGSSTALMGCKGVHFC